MSLVKQIYDTFILNTLQQNQTQSKQYSHSSVEKKLLQKCFQKTDFISVSRCKN